MHGTLFAEFKQQLGVLVPKWVAYVVLPWGSDWGINCVPNLIQLIAKGKCRKYKDVDKFLLISWWYGIYGHFVDFWSHKLQDSYYLLIQKSSTRCNFKIHGSQYSCFCFVLILSKLTILKWNIKKQNIVLQLLVKLCISLNWLFHSNIFWSI